MPPTPTPAPAPAPASASAQTLYLIANAHIDPVWLWRWTEGCAEIRATCRAALDFLDADPALKFSRSSAGDLRWLEDIEPELLDRIRARALEGRWENVGGWWTQPDCNIPSGESFVRQALYGQAFFGERLGRRSPVGYNVDSFGHHANLPQILRKCGLRYYVHMRPGPTENPAIPAGYYHWEGIDGSRVLAYHIFDPYNATHPWGLEPEIAACRAHLDATGAPSAMLFYGMGDHGGGPTRETLDRLRELAGEPGMPALVHATPCEAFAAVEREARDLPVFRGELQHHASGCYAAHSEIKRLNRRAEEALLAAERMAAAASVLAAQPYPAAKLTAAWHDLLFNQFHDILAGSSVREAYTDARDQMGRALFTAEEVLNAAQQRLASRVETRGDGQAVLLFNPHPFPVRGLFETENLASAGMRGADLWRGAFHTAEGDPLPIQHLAPTVHTGSSTRLLVPVDLPALGYRLYHMRTPAVPPPAPAGLAVGPDTLDNGRLRVAVTPDGIRIDDLERGRPVLDAPGLRALVIDDPSDTWGHDPLSFDQVVGAFSLVGVRPIEEGPLRGALRAEYAFGASRLWLDVLLSHDRRAVEVRGKVLWLERQRMLKIALPVAVQADSATHEIPYAALVRPNNGEEEPVQQWIDLADAGAGLVVVNDGKYSLSVAGREIRQTILRTVPYAWSCCRIYPWEGMHVAWRDEDWMMDQGEQEFRLLLLPHDGDRHAVLCSQEAHLFNRPPMLLVEGAHPGPLPAACGFVTVETVPGKEVARAFQPAQAGQAGKPAPLSPTVRIEVLKAAEDARGLILRAVETAGAPASARFAIPPLGVAWEASFTPWEIKTFRIADGHAAEEAMLETGTLVNS